MKVMIILICCLLGFKAENHVNWKVSLVGAQAAGAVVELQFDGKIDNKWYVYSSALSVDGPMPTKLNLVASDVFELAGKLEPFKPKEKHDAIWEGKIQYFEKTAKLSQKIKLKTAGTVKGTLTGQACSNIDGMCMPFSMPFSIDVTF